MRAQDQCHAHMLKTLNRRQRRRSGDDALRKTLSMGDSMSGRKSDAGETARPLSPTPSSAGCDAQDGTRRDPDEEGGIHLTQSSMTV